MRQLVTAAIVLRRTDYGEADRILTFMTPEQGKVRVMARGVRKIKSKLAGGIELFSVSTITYAKGRSDIGTLVSARLDRHYGNIVRDIHRTMYAYELLKLIDTVTEDEPERAYFELLHHALAGLDDITLPIAAVQAWLTMQLLLLAGHAPELQRDASGGQLQSAERYEFDLAAMAFRPAPDGPFTPRHIKLLRLGFDRYVPHIFGKVQDGESLLQDILPLLTTMRALHLSA